MHCADISEEPSSHSELVCVMLLLFPRQSCFPEKADSTVCRIPFWARCLDFLESCLRFRGVCFGVRAWVELREFDATGRVRFRGFRQGAL